MLHEILGTIVFLALAAGSARLYEPGHRSKRYREGKVDTIASPRAFRQVYHWIRFSTLAMGIGALWSAHPFWLAVHHDPLAMYAGLLVATSGFAVFGAAKRTLGQQYSPCFDAYVPTRIVRTGVYAHVRHPIYTANLITLCGLTVATGSLWLAANLIVLSVYYLRSARVEEDVLSEVLPGYREYRSHTGRFVPRPW